jgi:hypothetical protein
VPEHSSDGLSELTVASTPKKGDQSGEHPIMKKLRDRQVFGLRWRILCIIILVPWYRDSVVPKGGDPAISPEAPQ